MEKRAQGDSIARDVSSPTITNFTGWTGVWAILAKPGTTPIKTGAMTVSTDLARLEARIPPYDGADVLPIGKPYIELQVSNTSLQFRRTLPLEQIEIIAQGIV